jgi:hypothetical protein
MDKNSLKQTQSAPQREMSTKRSRAESKAPKGEQHEAALKETQRRQAKAIVRHRFLSE